MAEAFSENSKNCYLLVLEAVNKSLVTYVKEGSLGPEYHVNDSDYERYRFLSESDFGRIIHTYSEIEVLTNLVQCNEKGETPLEIAMKGENIYLIDELVKYLKRVAVRAVRQSTYLESDSKTIESAKCRVLIVMTAIDQLFFCRMPIMELIEHLTHLSFDIFSSMWEKSEWFDMLAKVVIKSTLLSRTDKIIVLELMGASSFCNTSGKTPLMFRCWRDAMSLRYLPTDGEPLLPKILLASTSTSTSSTSVASSIVFGSDLEVNSMEELNLLEENSKFNIYLFDREERKRIRELLQRQSLLVIRRITSQANHGHHGHLELEQMSTL
jgi:hypothetical protein